MITAWTPTGPQGACDVCSKPFGHYEGMANCGICGADHCDACMSEAVKRGDCDPDGDFDGERMIDLTNWKGCLRCSGKCQTCQGSGKREMNFTCFDCQGTGTSASSREIEREEREIIANLRLAENR